MTKNCPGPTELLTFVLGQRDTQVAEHINTCDTCRPEVSRLREVAEQLRFSASVTARPTGQCLNESDLAELANGVAGDERRAELVSHLAVCPACRDELASVARALGAPGIRDEIASLDRPAQSGRRHRLVKFGGTAGLIAATVAVLLLSLPSATETPDAVQHRGPVITSAVQPVVLAPRGTVQLLDTAVWSSVPQADVYELTLFDEEGSILFQIETRDTVELIPDTLSLTTSRSYFCQVKARIDFDRWVESELTEFILAPGADEAP